MKAEERIAQGEVYLGIELGSTRIKAVLIDPNHKVLAKGEHAWENRLEDGVWTYHMTDVETGLRSAYADLCARVREQYQMPLQKLAGMGISAMMHGYLALDQEGELLAPFRTWRNTMTQEAAKELTELFSFPIPQRWSIAHLYQAIKRGEEGLDRISYLTTLAGYVHWRLTGERVLGIGDASGIFPIDVERGSYRRDLIEYFVQIPAVKELGLSLEEILPQPRMAGQAAGFLQEEGARLLDPSGDLQAGIPLCPPEGDAGTGMVATNSVGLASGNVSAGTSIFAMVVMKDYFKSLHPELDLVTTPEGKPVAMAHCNNGSTDLDAWVKIFAEYNEAIGHKMNPDELYRRLYELALAGDADCGGLLSYNYYSGEHLTHCQEGRPMQLRRPQAHFTLANFMRSNLYASMATLKMGMDILRKEGVPLRQMYGHGGLFKTKGVGQRFMSAALSCPIAVMETASEGGAWGIAILAAYLQQKRGRDLASYLQEEVFVHMRMESYLASAKEIEGFEQYMEDYEKGLVLERMAIEQLP